MVTEERKTHKKREQACLKAIIRREDVSDKLAPKLQRSTSKMGALKYRQKILIVSEGEKSEPQYFNWLKKKWRVNAEIEIIGAAGAPKDVVQKAISLFKDARSKKTSFDQVWCVFDKDDFPSDSIDEAFAIANRHQIRIAFSNESFEVWYLLHFNYFDSALGRRELCKKLSAELGFSYVKNDTKIFPKIQPQLTDAVRNARRLFEINGSTRANPVTGIFLLIKELATYAANSANIRNETAPIIRILS